MAPSRLWTVKGRLLTELPLPFLAEPPRLRPFPYKLLTLHVLTGTVRGRQINQRNSE